MTERFAVKIANLEQTKLDEAVFLIQFKDKPGFAKFYRCEIVESKIYLFQQNFYDLSGDQFEQSYKKLQEKPVITRLGIYQELA